MALQEPCLDFVPLAPTRETLKAFEAFVG